MSEVWAGGSERDLDSVAVLERDVVASVGRALAISVTSARVEVPLAAAAYDEYLRGKACLDQATPVSVREAIDHFERAVAAGGNYASAHAGLAEAYQRLAAPGWEIEPPANLYEKARFHADRALAINPRLSEALAVRTMIRMFYEWDRERPLGDILDTIYANPSYAPAQQYYAAILTALGRVDEAVLAAQRGVNLNRLSPSASAALGIAEYYAGHNSDAIAQLSTALSLDDASATTHWGLGQAYRASGDAARAIAELQRATELAGWSGFLRAHLAYTLAVAGQRDRALAVQREIDAQGGYVPPYHRALIAAGLGDQQAMMRALEQALADRSGWIMLLPAQPEFAAVRDRAEFKQLFARARPMP
jgi:tetratricopeptide (TPR) repeat protein